MKHLGDITKINGYDAPVVDCIIGGSPCQGMSVAGKMEGLNDDRSVLFYDQVRIVREMREQYVRNTGRTDNIRPRYMVWENVAGAISVGTPKGEDFRLVLEEIAKIKDKNAVIPRPPKGKWSNAGCIMGDGFSIAWRIFDNQFWGTPQRRRRIALVADLGGESAPEILFVRKSLSGNTDESQQARKGTAADPQRGIGVYDRAGKCIGVDTYNQCLTGSKAKALNSAATDSDHLPCVCYGFPLGFRAENTNLYDGKGTTLCNGTRPGFACGVVYSVENNPADSRVNVDESGKVQTLTSRMGTGGGNVPMVMEPAVYAIDQGGGKSQANVSKCISPTLTCTHGGEPAVCYKEKIRYIVRRLTPLECERLQGFPDGWTDIGDWTDSNGKVRKTSDTARYKALGNSIALPSWKWIIKRISAQYERDATMASLFDGIGGFPLIWEGLNGKGTCLLASEIEEFPIAVTKKRIGGD